MHPQRYLEESFQMVYNMLPNHQTCKNGYKTFCLLQNTVIWKKMIDDRCFCKWNLKMHKQIIHPQRSLEESFLTVYNMLPNHQTCKKLYETFRLLQNTAIQKKMMDDPCFCKWNLKIHKQIILPQRSLQESFLTEYNMLPNHQKCKILYKTLAYYRMQQYGRKQWMILVFASET